jgi:hypothetical protein
LRHSQIEISCPLIDAHLSISEFVHLLEESFQRQEATEAALGVGSGEFLDRFKASGWFLDDLVLTPVNNLKNPAERSAKCLAAQPSLAERIRAYQPLAIVSIMRGIGDIVNEAAVAAGSDAPRFVVPFHGNGQQRRFLDAMARIVPALPRAGEPH